MSELRLQWIAFLTIFIREVRRFLRIWPQTLLPPVITMALYLMIFGGVIGSRIGTMGGHNYMTYVLPGLVMMSIITNSFTNVAFSFFSTKFQRNVEELLISPTSSFVILAGYVLGSTMRGLIAGAMVMLLGMLFIHIHLHSIWITLMSAFLTALIFSLSGFINALYGKKFDDVSIVPTFVLVPLTYLGGVFYSINVLPHFWQKFSLLNPIFYQVNAFRYGILGTSDQNNITLSFGVMIIITLILATLSLYLLNKGEGLRT